jgi:hypothetical protein
MNPLVCAYCKKPGKMTLEHLYPTSLHKKLLTANKQETTAFWLARLRKEIPSEPKIRDVCVSCNNGTLSQLDAYVCALFDKTLHHIPERYERVTFEPDYHLLKRWLLKISFNSARIHSSHDLFALEAVLPYIIGEANKLGCSIQLYAQLSFPQEIPKRDFARGDASTPVIFQPTIHRVGHMLFSVHGVGQKILRAIHLRSFSFYLAFFEPNERRAVQDDFANVFIRKTPGAVLLRPSTPIVELICNGMGAWDSYKASQTTRFVFD